MPFEKGKSGNPSGKQTEKPWRKRLDMAIAQDDGERLKKSAEKLLDLAAAGEPWAVQMLADRLDGKVAQEITGADGGPLVVIQAMPLDEAL